MTDKAAAKPGPDAELAGTMMTIKRHVERRVAEIKRDLALWIDQSRNTSEAAPMSIALLETAIDRYLDMNYDDPGTLEVIEKAFHRAVRKRRGPLQ